MKELALCRSTPRRVEPTRFVRDDSRRERPTSRPSVSTDSGMYSTQRPEDRLKRRDGATASAGAMRSPLESSLGTWFANMRRMNFLIGEQIQVPGVILAAGSLALDRGLAVADEELLLLAIASEPPGTPAREALVTQGADVERISRQLRPAGVLTEKGATFPPAVLKILGWAQGFAAAIGDEEITATHLLMALLWNPGGGACRLLWRMDVPREAILQCLKDLGEMTPRSRLPEQREAPVGRLVWLNADQLPTVLRYLERHAPKGAAWGFNLSGSDRAWVSAEASLPIAELVERALAESFDRPDSPS